MGTRDDGSGSLVVAAYVFADEYPVPARGRPAKVTDAELVALAVAQAAIGIIYLRDRCVALAATVTRGDCSLA